MLRFMEYAYAYLWFFSFFNMTLNNIPSLLFVCLFSCTIAANIDGPDGISGFLAATAVVDPGTAKRATDGQADDGQGTQNKVVPSRPATPGDDGRRPITCTDFAAIFTCTAGLGACLGACVFLT